MALKVSDLIREALMEIGALADGETPPASDMQLGLRRLNMMLDSWSNDELMVFANTTEVFDLVNGKQIYYFGPGGDFDSIRPTRVDYINCVQSSPQEFETPVTILNQDQWTSKALKNVSSSFPSEAFVEYTFPLAKISVFPIPNQAAKLSIVTQKRIARFATIEASIVLPEGYEEALMYGLAVRLSKPFGKQVDPSTAQSALNAKSKLMKTNKQEKLLRADQSTGTRPNIFKGS